MSSRYRIFCDGELFSDTYIPDPDWHAQEPLLKMGDNSAGSFEFALTPSNVGYDMIERMASTIVIGKDDDVFWSGRVISQTEDFFKRRKYVCEGALAYLNDSHVGIDTSSLSLDDLVVKVITDHNNKMTVNQTVMNRPSAFRALQILKSNVQIMELLADEDNLENDSGYVFNNETTLDWISNNVVGALGCHVYIKYTTSVTNYLKTKDPKPYIVFVSDYLSNSDQQINFGVNLLDFTKNWDLSNLVTVIIPRGEQLAAKTEEVVDTVTPGPKTDDVPDDGLTHYLTVKYAVTSKTRTGTSSSGKPIYKYTYYGDQNDPDGNKNDIYVYNTTAYRKYGRIEKIVDFSDVTDAKYLLKLAKIYVKSMQFDGMQIEMSAIDLHNIDSTITRFNLLEMVRCISVPHGMDTHFPIVEMELDLENPANDKYTLGESNVMSLSGVSRSTNRELMAHFSGYPAPSRMLDVARYEVTNILNNRQVRGYVNIVQVSDTSQAVVISDTQDWHQATNLWKWDMNGLGFSDKKVAAAGYSRYDMDGEDRWFKTAITADGHIVADFISTGILSDGAGTAGHNWWNLTNGTIHISTGYISDNASIYRLQNGREVDMGTVGGFVAMSQDASTNAQTALANAQAARAESQTANSNALAVSSTLSDMETGGKNLIDSTDTYSEWGLYPNKKWSNKDGIVACIAPAAGFRTGKTFIQSRIYKAKKDKVAEYKPTNWTYIANKKIVLSMEMMTSDTPWGSKTGTNEVRVYVLRVDQDGAEIARTVTVSYGLRGSWTRYISKYDASKFQSVAYKGKYKTSNNHFDATKPSYVMVKIINCSAKSVKIQHIKLELGTVATDWSLSDNDSVLKNNEAVNDLETYIDNNINSIEQDYKDAISEQAKSLTQGQVDAISSWSTQETIFNNLTKDGDIVGLFIEKPDAKYESGHPKAGQYKHRGQYWMGINANYIQSGCINAGLIKAGIISNTMDLKAYNARNSDAFYFNLATGAIKAKYMVLKHVDASGTLTTGSTAKKIKIANGCINFYSGKKLYSRLAFISAVAGKVYKSSYADYNINANTGHVTSKMAAGIAGRQMSSLPGVYLSVNGDVYLKSTNLFINKDTRKANSRKVDTKGAYYETLTKTIHFDYVANVSHPDGNKGYQPIVTVATFELKVVQGLIVSVNPIIKTKYVTLHVI